MGQLVDVYASVQLVIAVEDVRQQTSATPALMDKFAKTEALP